jgi:hypothetical protein
VLYIFIDEREHGLVDNSMMQVQGPHVLLLNSSGSIQLCKASSEASQQQCSTRQMHSSCVNSTASLIRADSLPDGRFVEQNHDILSCDRTELTIQNPMCMHLQVQCPS